MSRRRRMVAAFAAAVAGFAAAAGPAQAVRFGVIGDWGMGTSAQKRVAQQMCAQHAAAQFSLIATVGDNFYPTGTATPQTWNTPMRCLIKTGLPWRAAWGNHDVPGPSTRTVLNSGRRWYTVTPGGAVRLIYLDANQPTNTKQLRFLRTTLAAEKTRPVIVIYHQPTRTAGTHAPQRVQQRVWEPLFVKYGVKLVLQGHNHNYERIQYKNVTYITAGGGGAPLYPCIRPTSGLKTCQSVYNFLVIEASSTKIGVRAFNDSGKVIDRIRLVPPRG